MERICPQSGGCSSALASTSGEVIVEGERMTPAQRKNVVRGTRIIALVPEPGFLLQLGAGLGLLLALANRRRGTVRRPR